jgi:hypothetical protein
VQCDGYPQESSSRSCGSRQILPIPQPDLCGSIFSSEVERQYFDLFCTRTGFEILPGFESSSIRQTLLESCTFDPCIRHSIIAIGALDKTAEMTRDFGSLAVSPINNTSSNPHHTAALQQYSKAVQHMNRASLESQMDIKTTLLTCLLIVCFEAWNGNLHLAVQQVHIAISLLQEWYSSFPPNPEREMSGLSPAPDIISHDLLQIFCRLSIQLAFIADESATATRAIIGSEGRLLVASMPVFFSTLREAAMYQQAIQRRGGHFIATYGVAWASGNPTPTEEQYTERAKIELDCRRWLQAFEPLVKSVKSVEERRHAHTILLQMSSGLISIATALSTDEMVYDNYIPVFAQIVDLAEDVLNSYPQTKQSGNTHFCFDTRIILPLWKAGLKCRDQAIRRKAVALLMSRPMKEGIWDSILAGKMVRWVMELEEEHLDFGYGREEGWVPAWARIKAVKWSSDLEARNALLVCRQRTEEFEDEVVMRRKIVAW